MIRNFYLIILILFVSGCSLSPISSANRAFEAGDYSLVKEILTNSASDGSVPAMRELGFFYLNTDTEYHDKKIGLFWLERAILQGNYSDFDSQKFVVQTLHEKHNNPDKKIYWLTYGARWNDVPSIMALYELNEPVPTPDLYLTQLEADKAEQARLAKALAKSLNNQIDGNIKVFQDLMKK
jgi:hypothetical protein